MKRLKLRRQVVRNLVDAELGKVAGGVVETTYVSCPVPGCIYVTKVTTAIGTIRTLQGCTTAVDCP